MEPVSDKKLHTHSSQTQNPFLELKTILFNYLTEQKELEKTFNILCTSNEIAPVPISGLLSAIWLLISYTDIQMFVRGGTMAKEL